MSLQKVKQQGFTIVELLIVVVVIGILAAIVIVAYVGITQQAKNSAWQSNATSIRKVAETYQAQMGEYPDDAADFSAGDYADLPAGVTVTATNSMPSYATVSASADASPKEFHVNFCTTDGLKIYYPSGSSTVNTIALGDTSTGCADS